MQLIRAILLKYNTAQIIAHKYSTKVLHKRVAQSPLFLHFILYTMLIFLIAHILRFAHFEPIGHSFQYFHTIELYCSQKG